MGFKIYNTLTRKKEEFVPLEDGKVRMYVCGVTVYNKAHVGHAMSALVFDILRRYLEYRGFEVRHVTNFTDVDDKIINRAAQLGMDPMQMAAGYIDELREQMKALNIKPASVYPQATTEMGTIIQMIQGLIDKGFAYAAEGDVYFRVQKDKQYGKLSGRRIEDMRSGEKSDPGEIKEDNLDFALWKSAKPGEPSWDSPWGYGRPGWHIECSAMSLKHLGEQIDIHGGGNDLVFPHHENEIAQTESLTDKAFAKYWVHNGMLNFSGEKMSKSIGNIITIEEFLQHYSADTIRFMVLNSGYRSPLTFNDEVVEQSKKGLERIRSALKPASPGARGASTEIIKTLENESVAAKEKFIESMDDDLNTAGALAAVFDLVRIINATRAENATDAELHTAQTVVRELTSVWGLSLEENNKKSEDAAPFIELLLDLRKQLRNLKQWELSDAIRDKLLELGVVIEDNKEGSIWHFK